MTTLITINYNGAGDTLGLLRSLERQSQKNFVVIVVDNASEPEDRARLGEYATTSPLALDIIYSDTNRGFSGGNNLAIRKALAQKSEWVLLINNDTTVEPDFIEKLLSHEHPSGIVGIPLAEGKGIAYAGKIRWLTPTLPHVYSRLQPSTFNLQLLYAIGAGMLIHESVFERVGFLDERYFLYFEDADFSLRARDIKVPFIFLEQPIIRHSVSQSTSRLGSPLLLRYHMRNALYFNQKHGPWWVRTALPFWTFFIMIKQVIKLVLMPSRRPAAYAIAAGISDFYAHQYGKISAHRH